MALSFFKDVTKLINEEVLAVCALAAHRTFKEEIIHTLRNQFFGSGSSILSNFVDFDGTKYMFLTKDSLIQIKIKGLNGYHVADKNVFLRKDIKNAQTTTKRTLHVLSFDYQGEQQAFKLLAAAMLPDRTVSYDREDTYSCIAMRDELIRTLVDGN